MYRTRCLLALLVFGLLLRVHDDSFLASDRSMLRSIAIFCYSGIKKALDCSIYTGLGHITVAITRCNIEINHAMRLFQFFEPLPMSPVLADFLVLTAN